MLKENKGFSLLEVMIALAIVGVILVLAVSSYFNMVEIERTRTAINDISNIRAVIQNYHISTGDFFPNDDIRATLEGTEILAYGDINLALDKYSYKIEKVEPFYQQVKNTDNIVDIIPVKITATRIGDNTKDLIFDLNNYNNPTNRIWRGSLVKYAQRDPNDL